MTVTDSQGIVVFGGPDPQRLGTQVPERSLRRAIPIDVDGEVAGYLIFDFFEDRRAPDAPENLFVAALNRGIVLAALAATVGALLLGAFLARTLARPIGELTAATQRIARGELGLQVPVRTHDELGKLASSFNSMSADLEKASRLRRQMTATSPTTCAPPQRHPRLHRSPERRQAASHPGHRRHPAPRGAAPQPPHRRSAYALPGGRGRASALPRLDCARGAARTRCGSLRYAGRTARHHPAHGDRGPACPP